MPQDRDFKKLVRQRMSKTGESYSSARAHLRSLPRTDQPDLKDVVRDLAFDRLTPPAKVALTHAQDEARAAGVGSIGTDYLVIGLLRSRKGVAAKALRNLGVRLPRVRQAVARRGRSRGPAPANSVPAETRQVLERAFVQADTLGQYEVWTAQVLGAMMAAGDVAGGQILSELGVTLESCAAETSRVCAVDGPEQATAKPAPVSGAQLQPELPSSGGVRIALQAAHRIAEAESAQMLRSDHLLSAIISTEGSLPVVGLLAHAGADLEALRAKLRPPRAVTRLERAVKAVQEQRVRATSAHDVKAAASLRDKELELRRKLTDELDHWQAGWR